jgi:hypothetical protein
MNAEREIKSRGSFVLDNKNLVIYESTLDLHTNEALEFDTFFYDDDGNTNYSFLYDAPSKLIEMADHKSEADCIPLRILLH